MISLGFVIGTIITWLLICTCVGILIACKKKYFVVRSAYVSDDDYNPLVKRAVLISLPIIIGLYAGVTYPWSWEYHSYQPVGGTISNIDKRIIGNGVVQENFVVRFSGSDQQYSCNDTRCASLRTGDKLQLNCIRQWQYASVDGYNCRYNQ